MTDLDSGFLESGIQTAHLDSGFLESIQPPDLDSWNRLRDFDSGWSSQGCWIPLLLQESESKFRIWILDSGNRFRGSGIDSGSDPDLDSYSGPGIPDPRRKFGFWIPGIQNPYCMFGFWIAGIQNPYPGFGLWIPGIQNPYSGFGFWIPGIHPGS